MTSALLVTHVDWRTYYQPALFARALLSIHDRVRLIGADGDLFLERAAPGDSFDADSFAERFVPRRSLLDRPGRAAPIRLAGHAVHAARVARAMFDPDLRLVVAFDAASLWPLAPLARRLVPKVPTGVWFLEYEEDGYQENLRARSAHRMLRRGRRESGFVPDFVVETNVERLALRRWLAPETPRFVLPNAPRLADEPPRPSRPFAPDGPRFLYAGTAAPFARLDALLAGFSRAVARGGPAARARLELVTFGSGIELEALRARVEACPARDRVTMHPREERERLRRRLREEADAAAVFSDARPDAPANRRFPSPNKLGEILAAGLPVLVSENSTLAFVEATGAGVAVRADDPDDVARGLERLCDGEFRARAGAAARAWFEREGNFEAISAPLLEFLNARRAGAA